jgi:hypothetical protein
MVRKPLPIKMVKGSLPENVKQRIQRSETNLKDAAKWAAYLLRFREVTGPILGTEKALLNKQLFLLHFPRETLFLCSPIRFLRAGDDTSKLPSTIRPVPVFTNPSPSIGSKQRYASDSCSEGIWFESRPSPHYPNYHSQLLSFAL